ncbi:MAG: peptide deformylase [Promethearchaeota archaeon]
MAIKPILLMGNPVLYEISEEVSGDREDQTEEIISDLRDTLKNFRKINGFGRAIAAVQIGVKKRIIFMKTDKKERVFINPKLEFLTTEQIELWDDCFSLPNIRVRVKRYKSVKVSYLDSNWQQMNEIFTDDLSELIQHEHDHLDGILAVARAIDKNSFAFESEMSHYSKM